MRLTLYPAIDLKGGRVVRLRQGRMTEATVYSEAPAATAEAFAAAGCRWLHVVDLDGAIAGHGANVRAVSAIRNAVAVPLQLGGGIRDMAAITRWLEAGVTRIILGSAAVKDPALVKTACRRFPNRIAIAIDARDGMVAAEGWVETTTIPARDLALRFEDAGAAALVYTDIGRDGMLGGLDFERTIALADTLTTRVIASGGVADLADLELLRKQARGTLEGVIVGRALYEGRIAIADALRALDS